MKYYDLPKCLITEWVTLLRVRLKTLMLASQCPAVKSNLPSWDKANNLLCKPTLGWNDPPTFRLVLKKKPN